MPLRAATVGSGVGREAVTHREWVAGAGVARPPVRAIVFGKGVNAMSMPAEDLIRLDGPTALLSRFAADLDYARMTEAARRAVRRHTLDSVGAIIAGSRQLGRAHV